MCTLSDAYDLLILSSNAQLLMLHYASLHCLNTVNLLFNYLITHILIPLTKDVIKNFILIQKKYKDSP